MFSHLYNPYGLHSCSVVRNVVKITSILANSWFNEFGGEGELTQMPDCHRHRSELVGVLLTTAHTLRWSVPYHSLSLSPSLFRPYYFLCSAPSFYFLLSVLPLLYFLSFVLLLLYFLLSVLLPLYFLLSVLLPLYFLLSILLPLYFLLSILLLLPCFIKACFVPFYFLFVLLPLALFYKGMNTVY